MEEHMCEYCDCERQATWCDTFNRESVWLCEEHSLNDDTGYCGLNCQLGYGCSQEC